MIGIDTEWGDRADRLDADSGGAQSAAPAVMQLAVQRTAGSDASASDGLAEPEAELEAEAEAETGVTRRRSCSPLPAAWVIDCSKPSPELRRLTSWLLGLRSPSGDTASAVVDGDSGGVAHAADAPILVGFAFAHDITRLITLSGHDAAAVAGGDNTVRKTPLWSHFYTTNDHLTKTGSGQTWETLRKRVVFSAGWSEGDGPATHRDGVGV